MLGFLFVVLSFLRKGRGKHNSSCGKRGSSENGQRWGLRAWSLFTQPNLVHTFKTRTHNVAKHRPHHDTTHQTLPSCNTDQGVLFVCESLSYYQTPRRKETELSVTRAAHARSNTRRSRSTEPDSSRSTRAATRKVVNYAWTG